jgi:uncharacterized protein YqeY
MYIPLLLPDEEVATVAHVLIAVAGQSPNTALGKQCFEISEKIRAAMRIAAQVNAEKK